MAPRPIVIAPVVHAVLARGRLSDDGLVYYLPAEQLPRDLYLDVNKVLAALGGKWDRKLRGHRVPVTFAHALHAGQREGVVVDQKKALSAFYTSPALALRVAELARLDSCSHVLEPSAGEGALATACVLKGVPEGNLTLVEIDAERCAELRRGFPRAHVVCTDFLIFLGPTFDRIVMNPPYDRTTWRDHLLRPLLHLAEGGRLVAILPASAVSDAMLLDLLLSLPRHTWQVLGDGAFHDAGTDVRTCILTIEAGD